MGKTIQKIKTAVFVCFVRLNLAGQLFLKTHFKPIAVVDFIFIIAAGVDAVCLAVSYAAFLCAPLCAQVQQKMKGAD